MEMESDTTPACNRSPFQAPLTDYIQAFHDGTTLADRDGEPVRIKIVDAGNLLLPTGRLIACDPFTFDTPAFATQLRAGAYPVVVSLATFPDGDERVACAMLRCTPAPPVQWRLALRIDQDPTILKPGEYLGYTVEAGTGCFVDEAVVDAWYDAAGGDAEHYCPQFWDALNAWNDRLVQEFDNGAHKVRNISLGLDSPGNLIAFESGWGDGTYATFMGYDVDGHVSCVMTDFRILRRSAP